MKKMLLLASVAVLALAATACGKGALNESCSTAGATTDECQDNLVCDTEAGSTVCLKQCTDQAQCDANQNCTGVSGNSTLKACHAK